MTRYFVAILVAFTLVVSITTITSAQSAPTFQLGFKVLADQIPDIVGTPLENEHFNLSNGNSEQHTTKGLMVWRKDDNWTAYTNGYMTWINGPAGVQSRLNSQRFDWEKDEAVPTPTQAPLQLPPGFQLVPTMTPEMTARIATPTLAPTPKPTLPPAKPLAITSSLCFSYGDSIGVEAYVGCSGTLTNQNADWIATNVSVTGTMIAGDGSGRVIAGRLGQLTKTVIGPGDHAYFEVRLPSFGNPVRYEINAQWIPAR